MERARLLILLAIAAAVPLLALAIVGIVTGERIWFLITGFLLVGDCVALLLLSRWKGPRGDSAPPYLDGVDSVATDRRAYREATEQESQRAEITAVTNTGKEKSVDRFGTEITLRLVGSDATGVIRTFLTPAELAQLQIGREIEVKPAPAYPGTYILAEG